MLMGLRGVGNIIPSSDLRASFEARFPVGILVISRCEKPTAQASLGELASAFWNPLHVELQSASMRFQRGRNQRGMRPGVLPRLPDFSTH